MQGQSNQLSDKPILKPVTVSKQHSDILGSSSTIDPATGLPRASNSPVQQAQTKRKPPLPSPFLSKHDGSHSKLALYS